MIDTKKKHGQFKYQKLTLLITTKLRQYKNLLYTVSPLIVRMLSARLGGGDSKKNTSDKKNQFTVNPFGKRRKTIFLYQYISFQNILNMFDKMLLLLINEYISQLYGYESTQSVV